MKANISFDMGGVNYQFEIEEPKEMDTLHKAIVLGNPPKYCNACQNNQYFRLDTNKDKEANTYVNVVCTKCGAKAKLGLYKSGGYFWHKFEKYNAGNANTETYAETTDQKPKADMPF